MPMDTILREPPSARRYARSPVYQFSEAATKLGIKNVFDAFYAFVMRKCIKLAS